ncbi:hypothetical protein [Actinobacillus pleuropneumoniae]|uniref:Lipoprotein n=1 Tax=Actinobacillus pleuropneumoniae TaxID=715 RepID=A0A9Q4DHN1_ACTPL|nr:hypothetical protein [Actinobacillus pleuropneumoniae]MCL7720426.1 hypothetical protein [Actinobacillus pleuropneumoniae]MCL7728027.1 hypothetical protein [Actinobacillus pleuropneumoniae]MCL7729621.1 hypothetical protein [Actinobacillus pleuropneumoniae]MCY6367603.1 hypothetical protein [Actinobacillus pleuropneumoniae]MCY6384471.1 hypothetical protein [Actinobacillus pleuropneumoniae]
MKKVITLSAVIALSIATVAEAKRGGSSRSVTGKPIAAQKTQSIQSNTQKDATFDNTQNRAMPNQQQAQASGGNRLASFATGAAAGYVLSEMLAPTEAQAQTQTQQAAATTQPQAVQNAQNTANTAATVATFKSIGGQVDPFLVEKTDGYRRYCIAGVQYLAAAQGGQSAPVVMVNPNGSPLACNLVQ